MKKILLLIASVIVSVGMNAQGIEIYKGSTLEASYTGSDYKAVLKKTPGTPIKPLDTDANLIQAWFSVESGKQVQFTKGNLWYGTKKLTSQSELEETATYSTAGYHFESNQQDYYYPEGDNPTYSADHVCRFFWSTTTDNNGTMDYLVNRHEPYAGAYAAYSSKNVTDAFCYGEGNKANITVDGKTVYYALTMPEWFYLLEVRSGNRFAKAMVNGVNGLLIFPDGYTLPSGYSESGGTGMAVVNKYDAAYPTQSIPDAVGNTIWTTMQSDGVVFLPAAGIRPSSTLNSGGTLGYYWSATPNPSTNTYAFYLLLGNSNLNPASSNSRNSGYSVRLVR